MSENLLNQSSVKKKIDVSDVTIHRRRKAGEFPEPININGRNYWKESVIDQYIENLATKAYDRNERP